MSQTLIDCACGCGQKRSRLDRFGKQRLYICGHGGRRFTSEYSPGRRFQNGEAGEKSHTWNGGRGVTWRGYIRVNIGPYKRELEHRVVMERFLGRKLTKTEHVHHKNGDKTDNRLENLELLDESSHHKLHAPKKGRLGKPLSEERKTKLREAHREYWRKKRGF
jgi:hypothetical protein